MVARVCMGAILRGSSRMGKTNARRLASGPSEIVTGAVERHGGTATKAIAGRRSADRRRDVTAMRGHRGPRTGRADRKGREMAGNTGSGGGARANRARVAVWGTAAALVSLPLVAMLLEYEVNWGVEDFVFAIALVAGVGIPFELAVRATRSTAYRAAAGLALAAAFVLVWINLAVGIIGSEDNSANLMFFGVLSVGMAGAAIARFRPRGMARALVATAIAQGLVAVVALLAGSGSRASGPGEILGLTGFFAALWLASAWLFQKAAQERDRHGASR